MTTRLERTSSGGSNINILLELIERTKDIPGDLAECGVYRGSSLVAMGLYLKQQGIAKKLWGFDSFEGFDVLDSSDLGGEDLSVKKVGGFSDTSFTLVRRKADGFGLTNVHLIPGYFVDSLPKCPANLFSFVHIDCDIYIGYQQCLEYFYPRMAKGGIILFDEYDDPAWPGAKTAVDEFCGETIRLERVEKNNFVKAYVVKE